MNELQIVLAKAVTSLWHPVENLFGFSFPSQSEIRCWQAKLVIECKTWPWPELELAWTIACSRRFEKNLRRRKKTRGRLTLAPPPPSFSRCTIATDRRSLLSERLEQATRTNTGFSSFLLYRAWVRTLRSKIDWVNLIFAVLSLTFI